MLIPLLDADEQPGLESLAKHDADELNFGFSVSMIAAFPDGPPGKF